MSSSINIFFFFLFFLLVNQLFLCVLLILDVSKDWKYWTLNDSESNLTLFSLDLDDISLPDVDWFILIHS